MFKYNDQGLLLTLLYGSYATFIPCTDAADEYLDEQRYMARYKDLIESSAKSWNSKCDISKCGKNNMVCHGPKVVAKCVKAGALPDNQISEAQKALLDPRNAFIVEQIKKNYAFTTKRGG